MRYWTKYAIFGVSFIVYQISPQVVEKPSRVMPKFGIILAHFIVDEISVICLFVDMLSHFEVTHFQLAAGRLKFGEIWSFPPPIF